MFDLVVRCPTPTRTRTITLEVLDLVVRMDYARAFLIGFDGDLSYYYDNKSVVPYAVVPVHSELMAGEGF